MRHYVKTVKDLIEELECFEPDMPVHITYNYGDHWSTQVAPRVDCVEEVQVVHSDYHRMPKVVADDPEDRFGDEQDSKTVVVIS